MEIACFLFGLIVGGFSVGLLLVSGDDKVEKSGVWVHRDRAYKLTRIEPSSVN